MQGDKFCSCPSFITGSYLNDNPQVPWDDLRYIFGEIMYGGHITDAWDRRTNNVYLEVWATRNIGYFVASDQAIFMMNWSFDAVWTRYFSPRADLLEEC